MNRLIENQLYKEDIRYVASLELPWKELESSSMLVSGATGLIGSFLIDVIMYRNRSCGMNCKVFALGRNEERAKDRFAYCFGNEYFRFVRQDINIEVEKKLK